MKTKQFKISEILQWQPQKEIDPLKINELTVDGKYTYPFYGQATLNHGIISYETLTPDVLNNKDGKPTILIHSNKYCLFGNSILFKRWTWCYKCFTIQYAK